MANINCPHCGAVIPDTSFVCPSCGTRFRSGTEVIASRVPTGGGIKTLLIVDIFLSLLFIGLGIMFILVLPEDRQWGIIVLCCGVLISLLIIPSIIRIAQNRKKTDPCACFDYDANEWVFYPLQGECFRAKPENVTQIQRGFFSDWMLVVFYNENGVAKKARLGWTDQIEAIQRMIASTRSA